MFFFAFREETTALHFYLKKNIALYFTNIISMFLDRPSALYDFSNNVANVSQIWLLSSELKLTFLSFITLRKLSSFFLDLM